MRLHGKNIPAQKHTLLLKALQWRAADINIIHTPSFMLHYGSLHFKSAWY